ncbi:glycosyltransferase family 87 protein [Qipengyuania vesicularis]|uniref:glycosyltransferase family 87 protein n=1 Tax=Qipengyuania vesicularis TaxID=2867232 RepID=UPI001C88AFE4|nr:glycosyltransferase family 87 protein [Qipengyuania vesicularis]MBX7527675.1 DUF2029 domain-containing protein [Qipengyuania vesicularis]
MPVETGGQAIMNDTSAAVPWWFRAANATAPVAALVGLAAFSAVVFFGFGKPPGTWMSDFVWFFAGGECFESGSHMYAQRCVAPIVEATGWGEVSTGLSYPPQFAPFAMIMSAAPLEVGKWIFYLAGILAACATLWLVIKTERRTRGSNSDQTLNHYWAVLLVLGASGVLASIWIGQLTLLLVPLFWLVFGLVKNERFVLAGLALAVISIKPQVAVLLFFWLLIHGRWKELASASAWALLLSVASFARLGPVESLLAWIESLTSYQNYSMNVLGSGQIMGLPSMLAVGGIEFPVIAATGLGAVLLIILRLRGNIDPFGPMALATILSLQMLVFSRSYDIALLAPAVALLWPTNRSSIGQAILFFGVLVLFCMPQKLGMAFLPTAFDAHFRTLLFLALAAIFSWCAWNGRERFTRTSSSG